MRAEAYRIVAWGVCILGPMLYGCNGGSSVASQPASIFGQNNLTAVSEDQRVGLAKVVGSLAATFVVDGARVAAPECTAIRLGADYLLTAAHCVAEQMIFNPWSLVENDAAEPRGFEIARFGNVVRLTYEGERDPREDQWARVAPLLKAPVYVNTTLDYAIYHLDSAYKEALAGLGRGIDLPQALENPISLTIWGHPNGVPLAKADCAVWQFAGEQWLYHDCDALSGSSGALIGDPSGQKPIAMQQAGPARNSGTFYGEHGVFESPEDFAKRRGCGPLQAGNPESVACITRMGHNRAIPLSVIAADLESHASDLGRQIQAL
jgi:hypothetical protein